VSRQDFQRPQCIEQKNKSYRNSLGAAHFVPLSKTLDWKDDRIFEARVGGTAVKMRFGSLTLGKSPRMRATLVTKSRWNTLIVILFFFAISYPFAVAEVRRNKDWPFCGGGGCSLGADVSGEINSSTLDELIRLDKETRLKAEAERKPVTKPVVFLDSPGGSVSAAIAIGRLLRKERFLAVIRPNAICFSACVLVLAGASSRGFDVRDGAKIGIHRPYLEVTQQQVPPERVTQLYQRMLQDIRAYFREMNIAEQLADAMLRVEPENLRLLNENDLESYGLTRQDPIDREVEQLNAAQKLGITRTEYMRRMRLIDRTCTPNLTLDRFNICFKTIYETGLVPTGR
jgi:ATP-dependent protease ClpP protease subunit